MNIDRTLSRTTRIPGRETPVYRENLLGPLTLNLDICKTKKAFFMRFFLKLAILYGCLRTKGHFQKRKVTYHIWA